MRHLTEVFKLVSILVTSLFMCSVTTWHAQSAKTRSAIRVPDSNHGMMKYDEALKHFRSIYNSENDMDESSRARLLWEAMTKNLRKFEVPNKKLDQDSAVRSSDISLGMNGKPVYLVPYEKINGNIRRNIMRGWEAHAFNEFVSDLMPLNRTLLDVRHEWCKVQNYSENLPQTSIIICFHNEAWSTLLRTVFSVLNRSPAHVLKEIILVDDFSDMPHLFGRLDDYLRNFPKVKLIRSPKRIGLIKARILGAKIATAPVVTFLDSHCECTQGWLEPLLDQISKDPMAVASPVIDYIHDNTFEYIPQNVHDIRIGGFTWELRFKWNSIPHSLKSRQPAMPIKTPTIAGGLFAINKQFFAHLGYYDEDFSVWGGENLELSFKTWMCGGSLRIVPCSHVGHVFRDRFPYSVPKESVKRNTVRLAKVWLDEYAKYFYDRIGNELEEYGDISERKKLRQKLNCKIFDWYLKNIYPELEIPNDVVASGRIFRLNKKKVPICLDVDTSQRNYNRRVNLIPCHFRGGNQYWTYTKELQIKRNNYCMDYKDETVLIDICHPGSRSQMWFYFNSTQQIMNIGNNKCLQTWKSGWGWRLILENCLSKNEKFIFENLKLDRLKIGESINEHNVLKNNNILNFSKKRIRPEDDKLEYYNYYKNRYNYFDCV